MHTTTLKRFLRLGAVVAALVGGTSMGMAATPDGYTEWLVWPDAKNVYNKPEDSHAAINIDGHWFYIDVHVTSTIADALTKAATGDAIYVYPGTYSEDVTLYKENIKLYGANAHRDNWTTKPNSSTKLRDNNNETTLTGTLTVSANNVEINGFRLTGGGNVINTTATHSNPLKGFKFLYNLCENTSLSAGDDNAIVKMGNIVRPSNSGDPTSWDATHRYVDLEIAHNYFQGAIADQTSAIAPVLVCGTSGTSSVSDNMFYNGGHSISAFNAEETLNIEHNGFFNVGSTLAYNDNDNSKGALTGKGAHTIRLFYCGVKAKKGESPFTCNIQHNIMDGCEGGHSVYSLIRVFNGSSSETAHYPEAGASTITCSHNRFRNKHTTSDQDIHEGIGAGRGSSLSSGKSPVNAVLFNDKKNIHNIDWRFNHFDQSELCLGWCITPWQPIPQFYFGSSSEIFEHTTVEQSQIATAVEVRHYGMWDNFDHGVTTTPYVLFGRKAPVPVPDVTAKIGDDVMTGNFAHAMELGTGSNNENYPINNVAQSFDIDDQTGDIYWIHNPGTTSGFSKRVRNTINDDGGITQTSKSKFPSVDDGGNWLFLSRQYAQVKGWQGEDNMILTKGGHGSNMCVTRYNGQVYVLTGGGEGCTYTNRTPTAIAVFPYKSSNNPVPLNGESNEAGVTVKLWQNKFGTLNNDPYPGVTRTNVYPGVDNDNNLLVQRSRVYSDQGEKSGGDQFDVYDLTQWMDYVVGGKGSEPKPLRSVFVKAGDKKQTGSRRAWIAATDGGFRTWADQGFTISGDYIYTMEGVGADDKGANGPNPLEETKGGYIMDTSSPNQKAATTIESVQIINVINWRTGEFIYRRAILLDYVTKTYGGGKGSQTGTSELPTYPRSCEPEGIKVHRDDNGRANFLVANVHNYFDSKNTQKRRMNIFAYKYPTQLNGVDGQGRYFAWDNFQVQTDKDTYGVDMPTVYKENATVEALVTVTNNKDVRNVTPTIDGVDGRYFTVEKVGGDVYSQNHTYKITFKPDGVLYKIDPNSNEYNANYEAYLRMSSPDTKDQVIPIYARYEGPIMTGIQDVIGDSSEADAKGVPVEYYDLNGVRHSAPVKGFNIVRYSNGTVSKEFVK